MRAGTRCRADRVSVAPSPLLDYPAAGARTNRRSRRAGGAHALDLRDARSPTPRQNPLAPSLRLQRVATPHEEVEEPDHAEEATRAALDDGEPCEAALRHAIDHDACDNCVGVPNLAQGDSDGDGRGDACSLEVCDDGRDNDGNSLVDADDPGCPALHIEKLAQPARGAKIGAIVRVRGHGFGDVRGTLELGQQDVSVEAWRDKNVKFAVPQLDGGVYLVQVMRGDARSERAALFVPGVRIGKKKAALRSLGNVFGGTSWWTYYRGIARGPSIELANPFWLYAALTAADPAERDRVVSTVAGIDATTYGASNVVRRRTARAFGACEQRYLRQIPDALLDQYLACAAYSGPKKRFRALPADVQLAILGAGRPGIGKSCFVGSAYQEACRDVARSGGVDDAALATLGF
jgi:hypothetical protein